ncbi:hypothetical protein MMC22_005273 [Lobaria immixta]|nr:hypothetical protein [Lobaria immixta]
MALERRVIDSKKESFHPLSSAWSNPIQQLHATQGASNMAQHGTRSSNAAILFPSNTVRTKFTVPFVQLSTLSPPLPVLPMSSVSKATTKASSASTPNSPNEPLTRTRSRSQKLLEELSRAQQGRTGCQDKNCGIEKSESCIWC